MRAPLEQLEEAIGHRFRDRDILDRALTHSSHVHEATLGAPDPATDNEQLEFLGDAVLGFLISEHLVRRFPAAPEGRLSKLRAHLVSAAHLHEVARGLNLGHYLQLGRGEEMSGGRAKRTLLVDALEALIAAMYLDSGIDAVRRFVEVAVAGQIDRDFLASADQSPVDFKSALQELAQARKLPPPRYSIVREKGPDHSKTFTLEVRVGEHRAQAEGYSKKAASQKAASAVLDLLRGAG